MTEPTTRTRIFTVMLPWPSKELSPNNRTHHMALFRVKKAYREACAWQAKVQGVTRIEADRLHVHLSFHKPTKRAMDLDNLLARMKSGLDGLADVLGVDDSRWTLSLEIAPTVGGMVVVEVSRAKGNHE